MNLVSIVLPTFNGSRYIEEAIESCLNQTHQNIELIIVDDASTDGVSDIIKNCKERDSRIISVCHTENKKLPAALNSGFAIAKGNYLTWTSDDNMYKSDAIEIMLTHLHKDEETAFVFSDFESIGEDGNVLEYLRRGPTYELPIVNTIGACFLYRREVYEAIGNFDSSKFLVEDWDYWLRVYTAFKLCHIPRSLYYYRTHDESLTVKRFKQQQEMSLSLVLENNMRHKSLIPDDIRLRAYLKGVRMAKNCDMQSAARECMEKALEISPDAYHYTSDELLDYVR